MDHIPFPSTRGRKLLSTTDQDVEEDMPKHARSCLDSNSSLVILGKGSIRSVSKMEDLPKATELSSVRLIQSSIGKERTSLTIDFDRLIVTTPSIYPSRSLDSNSTCPWVDCGTNNTAASSSSSGPSGSSQSVSPSGSAPASTSSPNAATGAQTGSSMLWLTLGAWLLKRFL